MNDVKISKWFPTPALEGPLCSLGLVQGFGGDDSKAFNVHSHSWLKMTNHNIPAVSQYAFQCSLYPMSNEKEKNHICDPIFL